MHLKLICYFLNIQAQVTIPNQFHVTHLFLYPLKTENFLMFTGGMIDGRGMK